MKRVCPNCAQFIDRKLEVCPYCKKSVKGERENILERDKNIKRSEKIAGKKKERFKKTAKLSSVDSSLYGKINIATPDSIYFNSAEYSAKKARGDYEPEKIKWWEIYKWADLVLTRRNINKVVNKNSKTPPENLSYISMIILTILIGFTGLHNFYSKNYRRGAWMLSLFSLSFFVVGMTEMVPAFANLKIEYSLGALPGLIVILMWFFDIIRVVFKKYIYQKTRIEYIKRLDIETRAKLGKKYIDLENCGKRVPRERRKKTEKV